MVKVKKEIVKNFPDSCGVYIMKDKGGRVIYVGKAVSLKKRVLSYFKKNHDSLKTQVLMTYVDNISYQKAASEYEALITEDRLIKELKPRFNIIAKDDKSFPYIKVSQEDFPRISIGRRKKNETGFDYFGPYVSAKLLRRALTILRRSFPFCSCRKFPKRACLNYDMGLCLGPCKNNVSKSIYLKNVRELEDFLIKKDDDLIDELSRKMNSFVKDRRFEEAAKIRDQIAALSILISLKKNDSREVSSYSDFELLGLKQEPKRVEAFDISNVSGRQAVGSMVSFLNGAPDKDNYRRFKIRSVEGIDDYAMMQEVVRRRYERIISENEKMPDLIVIDGGSGHLKAAKKVLSSLKIFSPVIAIAKEEELVYTVGKKFPLKLKRNSIALKLIQRVRDEAHRFALKYHHLLRHKDAFS